MIQNICIKNMRYYKLGMDNKDDGQNDIIQQQ